MKPRASNLLVRAKCLAIGLLVLTAFFQDFRVAYH